MYLGMGGFVLELTTTARLRRLITNSTASRGPVHSTNASNLRRQRLHRVAETDCSTDTRVIHPFADIDFGAEAFSAFRDENGAISIIDYQRYHRYLLMYPCTLVS